MSDRLRKARITAKISVEEMAESLRVDRSAISRWENGHTTPYHATILAYAALTGVDVDWIETGETHRKNRFYCVAVAA
jgi:transcriptional regulator with XRE-family HTH domain